MTNTPYSFLTAKELSTAIAAKQDPTDFEIEAMQHIDMLLDMVEDLEGELAEVAEVVGVQV